MSDYVEERIRAKLPEMTPEKRKRAERFLIEQAEFRAAQERADAAWARLEATPRWRLLKRRKLERLACLAAANFFRVAGNDEAGLRMAERV
jgi:hypothetical protein